MQLDDTINDIDLCKKVVAYFEILNSKANSPTNWTAFCREAAGIPECPLSADEVEKKTNRWKSAPPKTLPVKGREFFFFLRDYLKDGYSGFQGLHVSDNELKEKLEERNSKNHSSKISFDHKDFTGISAYMLGVPRGSKEQTSLASLSGVYLQFRYIHAKERFCVSYMIVKDFIAADRPVEFLTKRSDRGLTDVGGIVFAIRDTQNLIATIGKVEEQIDIRCAVFRKFVSKNKDTEHIDLKGVRLMSQGMSTVDPFAHRVWCYRLDNQKNVLTSDLVQSIDRLRDQYHKCDLIEKVGPRVNNIEKIIRWLTEKENISI